MSVTSPQTLFSLIVPTRERVEQVRRLLTGLAETASHPERLEVILVVDEDDAPSQGVHHEALNIKTVLMPPRQTMGALNMAGYEASTGRYLMLLNDDVAPRTPGWDDRMLECFQTWPDDVVLVHVNDLLFGTELCTFPAVTRRFCELVGGVCPREYIRYRIDDHLCDFFNLLAVLGERRMHYLPDVVFEHFNFRVGSAGDRYHHADQAILAQDAQRFDDLFFERKELALKLKDHIDDVARSDANEERRRLLDSIRDPVLLRVPQRLRIGSDPSVTIGVVGADLRSESWERCLSSLRSCSAGHELIISEHHSATESHLPRVLNRLLDAVPTDLVVLVWSPIVVEPAWLEGLSRCRANDVGVIVPSGSGVVFKPDGSGQYAAFDMASDSATAALSFSGPLALIDRTRCRQRFDEIYRRHFFDVDFGLRAWQAGLRVVASPHKGVELAPNDDRCEKGAGTLLCEAPFGPFRQKGPDPFFAAGVSPESFEADRLLFVDRWQQSGVLDGLQRDVWQGVPELRSLTETWHRAEGLLTPAPNERFSAYRERVDSVMQALRRVPLYEVALMDRAEGLLGDREPAATDHRAWLLGMGGRRRVFVERHGDYRIVLCGQFHALSDGHVVCSAPTLAELKARLDAGHVDIPGPPLGRLAVETATKLFAKARDLAMRIRRRFEKDGFAGLARAIGRRLGV